MMKAKPVIIILIFIVCVSKTGGLESVILKEGENGDIVLEQIGNSVFVRFFNLRTWGGGGETRRYMDITPLMGPDDFIKISNRIKTLGREEMVQKPHLGFWRFGNFSTAHELSPYWDPYPRYDISTEKNSSGNEYMFIYHPKGYDVDIENYRLSIWNFNVPNYQEGHVYVLITYFNDFTDSMTDEELFEASREQVEILKGLLN